MQRRSRWIWKSRGTVQPSPVAPRWRVHEDPRGSSDLRVQGRSDTPRLLKCMGDQGPESGFFII